MSRKRLLKRGMLLLLLLCMIQTVDYGIEPVIAAPVEEIQPMADKYDWKYKKIDGKLYKRRYNRTKHRWEGDWIPV